MQSRAVHQFRTLIRRGLLAVWAVNAQTALGKLGSIRPQWVETTVVGPWLHFAVRKSFVAVPTTEYPLGHACSLGTDRHRCCLNLFAVASHSHTYECVQTLTGIVWPETMHARWSLSGLVSLLGRMTVIIDGVQEEAATRSVDELNRERDAMLLELLATRARGEAAAKAAITGGHGD